MGGTVAVTVRLESGEEHRMHRWTNSMPWFFNSVKFFQKDSSHIAEYMKQWEEMRDDWNTNRKSKKFKHNMTECYAPYPATLAPCSYGIVVFDFMKNAVVSCQGYTSFTNSHISSRWFDNDACNAQVELFKAGRVKKIHALGENGEFELPIPASVKEFEDEFFTEKKVNSKHRMTWLEYDTKPFVIHDFEDHNDGFMQAKEAIVDLGFALTLQDEKDWNQFFKDRE